MGTLTVKSQKTTYEYVDTQIFVTCEITVGLNNQLQAFHGDCYRNAGGQPGDYFGFFDAYPTEDSSLDADISKMTRADNNLVWAAIDDINSQVFPED